MQYLVPYTMCDPESSYGLHTHRDANFHKNKLAKTKQERFHTRTLSFSLKKIATRLFLILHKASDIKIKYATIEKEC